MITIVGMGVKDNDITVKGLKAVNDADVVYSRVKTKYNSIALNDLISSSNDFDELDKKIANTLLSAKGKVVYLVYGDGFGDSVTRLLDEVTIIPAPSEYRGRQPSSQCLTMSAYDIMEDQVFVPGVDTVIYQIDDVLLAGKIKLSLLEYYDAEQIITFSTERKCDEITLEDLDRQKTYNGACIFIKGNSDFLTRKRFCLDDLQNIMKRLTAPDGCPWDKAQSHKSIRTNMIEEAYEAVEAINNDDLDNLIEELGDVLLQVVFNSDIAHRTGEFTFNDVISRLCEKLISRHTHIFGENKATDEASALAFWEQAKAKEKHYDTLKEQLARLPEQFPATIKAEKAISKSIKKGYIINKDNMLERMKAILNSELSYQNVSELLFEVVVLCVMNKVKLEPELLDNTQKFMHKVLPFLKEE